MASHDDSEANWNRRTDRLTDGWDHVLSQADDLTKNTSRSFNIVQSLCKSFCSLSMFIIKQFLKSRKLLQPTPKGWYPLQTLSTISKPNHCICCVLCIAMWRCPVCCLAGIAKLSFSQLLECLWVLIGFWKRKADCIKIWNWENWNLGTPPPPSKKET